jgi:hypothetical protein
MFMFHSCLRFGLVRTDCLFSMIDGPSFFLELYPRWSDCCSVMVGIGAGIRIGIGFLFRVKIGLSFRNPKIKLE